MFDPRTLKLSWHASEGSKALGEFIMDPLTVLGQPTLEHSRPNELKVSGGHHDGGSGHLVRGALADGSGGGGGGTHATRHS